LGADLRDFSDFIKHLPKAELHVHLVGSASPRVVADLAARYEGDTEVPTDPDAVADFFTFTDFTHFIHVFRSVVGLHSVPHAGESRMPSRSGTP
jgi:aminodeoxyfutalosine deaminase